MHEPDERPIHWHGNSLEIVRAFPRSVRIALGHELHLLEKSARPTHCRSMRQVGVGAWEIRIAVKEGAFRLVYVVASGTSVHVLHAFSKKTRRTPRADIELARTRYRRLVRDRSKK